MYTLEFVVIAILHSARVIGNQGQTQRIITDFADGCVGLEFSKSIQNFALHILVYCGVRDVIGKFYPQHVVSILQHGLNRQLNIGEEPDI